MNLEQRETQEALLQSEQKLRAIFETVLEAIVITDDDGVYLDANGAACELFGASREQIIGHSVGEFLAPEVQFESAWSRFQEAGHEQGRIALRRPDGDIRYAEYSAVANFIPGQNLSVMRDISARIQAEKGREDALVQLRERVKELTLLHHVGQLLDVRNLAIADLLQSIVDLIPQAWQFPEITVVRIHYGDHEVATPGFELTPWVQRAVFTVPGGHNGIVEVCYREERPQAAEGPFLAEERTALNALTGMLQADLERRQAAQALEQSETRYKTLFKTMAQGVVYQDAEGKVIDINPAARRILRLGDSDIATEDITNNHLDLVREDGSPFPPDMRPWHKALRRGEPVYGEVMGLYVPTEEGYRWVVINSIPQFRTGEEEPYQVYSTLEDITERKRAEERRAQLAALVESSQDAIIGVDFEGRISSWNRGARQIFGYEPAEAIGRHFNILAPPEHRHEQVAVVEQVRRGEKVDNYSTVRLTKDGRRIFVNFSISAIVDGTGQTVGAAGIARDITKQKQTEARLRFQAQLLDSVHESVIASDMQGRVVYWGPGAEALYGYGREEAQGRTVQEFMAQPDREEEMRMRLQVVFEHGAWQGEHRQRRKDGSEFWARTTLSLVNDAQGRPSGYIGIDRDVTAERQHERELEAIAGIADVLRTTETPTQVSAAIFEQLKIHLDAEGYAVALIAPDERHYSLRYVHGPYKQYEDLVIDLESDLTGQVIREGQPYSSEDLGPQLAGLDPPLPENWAGACVPLIASNKPLGALWIGRQQAFSDGEVRLLSSIADMLASAMQRSIYFERLEEQALRVQRIMDTVEDGLLLLDREQRVVLANPSAVEHLAVLGVQEGDSEAGGSWVGRRIAKLGEQTLEALLQAPTGQEQVVARMPTARREFSVASHPVLENGQKSGWVLVLRDVTDLRRTQEMVQQQERLAAVGQLAAGIAHDFNNVMSAIVLYAQILQRRDDLSDKERHQLDVIYRQANHAIHLIKQILDFSRRSVMERSAMDLVPFFKEIFRLFEHTLPETINLSLLYEASDFFVMADPTRLQQAITNLAINARDAMPDGGTFTVRLSRLELSAAELPPAPDMAPGAWLYVTVADDGEGMSPEMLQHAFEPFYTTKGPGKGTGLGLAQVYGIIRQHEGYITIDSVPQRGTTFNIYLPLLDDNESQMEEPVPTFAQARPASDEATILVVEDEEWARVAVEETLEALGYRVITARDGQAALDVLAREGAGIDLVLSDMVMPEMGGLKLFEHIRANHAHVKMIIMSGYPVEDDGRSLLEKGRVAWISKPFSVNELAQKVAELLG